MVPQRPQVQVEAVPQVEAVDPAAGAAAAAAGDRFQGEAEAEAAARVDRCPLTWRTSSGSSERSSGSAAWRAGKTSVRSC